MKIALILILFLSNPIIGLGNTLSLLLLTVEQNNPRLIALQKWLEAEETKARTGIYPDNPEVNFNYLFGNPAAIGNQREIGIRQTIRLPGYYLSKSAVQQLNFRQMQVLADAEKREVMHTVRSVYFRLVFLHQIAHFEKLRHNKAEKQVELFTEGFATGEISRLELKQARLHLVGVQTELQSTLSDIKVQTQHLIQLNGGISIDNLAFEYPADWLLPDLDAALAKLEINNPQLGMARLNIRQTEEEIRHQHMVNLPLISAGYYSESILGQTLQGFQVGVTIPLWQNNNMLRHARIQHEWAKANYSQQESEMNATVSGMYHELITLLAGYLQMKAVLEKEPDIMDNLELLRVCHISFTEYMVNAELIWAARIQFLQTEYEFFVLLSKLKTLL
ncbi:MAG TPA: TolC family protein [Bacteroidales bacterium]|nr:TolC family protein [Bacteroidales bacterium]